ncbi:MAG TPA: amidohydrolase family protein, partial [Anaerolineales bacterium]
MHNQITARRIARALTAALALAAVAAACGPRPTGPSPTTAPQVPAAAPVSPSTVESGPATLIFHNGVVLTMDKAQPTAQAIALAGDKILAVGSNDEILALKTGNTQVIDLQGLTLMPGFVDAHTHLLNELNTPATGTLAKAQELALQNGITTVGNLFTSADFLQEMQALDDSGKLRLRTSLYLAYADACGKVLGDWYKQYPPTHTPGEMLRIAGVKVYADGGSCGYAAVSWDRAAGGKGDLWFTQDQMNTIVSNIDAAGYQVAIHAIGDRAVNEALNAIEHTLNGRPNTLRHRIEHNVTVNPDDYPRYQQLGVVGTLQGNIWSCKDVFFAHGIVPDPPEYRAWNFPFRAMLDASPDAHFAWHSDFPWASINPFFHLYSMVTPNEIAGDLSECPDPSWAGNKTLTLDEALPMMTIEGAYAMFRETEVGSLVPGKYADLIILSGNPAADLNAIRNIKVWMTMVGGGVEWCAPGHEALCPSAPTAEGAPQSAVAPPVKVRLRITTTSDWATLTLSSGGTLTDAQLVSVSPEATAHGEGDNRFSINQPIDRASSGGSVELIVDATLSDAHSGGDLEFAIESGAIGDTTVTLFNYLQASPVEASTTVQHGTNKAFSVPV